MVTVNGTEAPVHYGDFQNQIYSDGMFSGLRPTVTTNLSDLEHVAGQVLSEDALGYILPSAGSGATAIANRLAFERWRIVPQMLRDVCRRDLSCDVLGTKLPAPLMIAPIGVQTLAHPQGECATARASAALGLTYIHSTQADHSIEHAAEACGAGPKWYQLYWPRDEELCLSFLHRAQAAGYSTLVLTVDTFSRGWRPADLDRGFSPFLRNQGISNYLSDPVFLSRLDRPPSEDPSAAARLWQRTFGNPALTWSNLGFLRNNWPGPIVIKGICSVSDARRAADAGVEGIVVSNHGGRQVDGAVAALDVLAPIADAVGQDLTVLFDSGIRNGADIFKALALGARAVLIGRPFVFGLALNGQAGVEHVLRCFLAELDMTMALSGYSRPSEISREAVTCV